MKPIWTIFIIIIVIAACGCLSITNNPEIAVVPTREPCYIYEENNSILAVTHQYGGCPTTYNTSLYEKNVGINFSDCYEIDKDNPDLVLRMYCPNGTGINPTNYLTNASYIYTGNSTVLLNTTACDESAKQFGENCTCYACMRWYGYGVSGFTNLTGVYYDNGTPTGKTIRQMACDESTAYNLRYERYMNEHGINIVRRMENHEC